MTWIDWLIVIIPVSFVFGMGLYSRRYIRSVVDFLAAGRICGRYVLSMGDIANGLSIIGIVAYVETHYKTGFALVFWNRFMILLTIFLSLSGYCIYRFRETKSMSIGQFLEMRYSRKLRIFSAGLRSLAEMLANMIMPAIAARFFIYYLDFPRTLSVFGIQINTYVLLVFVTLTLAISLICMGGTLALVITDAIQGMFLYPLMVFFVLFVLIKFSWTEQIIPVMMDRGPGESFINPLDIQNLRDFNVMLVIVNLMVAVLHRASWYGAGTTSAARSPHEQKMGSLLGSWKGAINTCFHMLIAVMLLTLLNHKDFANEAKGIRDDLCTKVATELFEDGHKDKIDKVVATATAIPPQIHSIGNDAPLCEKRNMDKTYLDAIHETLLTDGALTASQTADKIVELVKDGKTEEEAVALLAAQKQAHDSKANSTFQQFRTLYYQLLMASSMRRLLPTGMIGMFFLLLVMAMISTDDSRIFSAALTITQDCVVPFCKNLSQKQHVLIIRLVSIGVGVFFIIGSCFMKQLDYINLFTTLATMMWMGGCGPMIIFGLYSRFATTAGAWASLLTGTILSVGTWYCTRFWADGVYPFLQRHDWVEPVGGFLETVSKPFNPYVEWHMNPVRCPINSYEFYVMMMILTLVIFIVVSLLTCRTPFNLDRMLHRGKYNLDGVDKGRFKWTPKNVFVKLIGITPEYSRVDRFLAYFSLCYSLGYCFLWGFVGVMTWNSLSYWSIRGWDIMFLVTFLIVPGTLALIASVWLGYGGYKDMRQMFRDLEKRKVNLLDNGQVEGNMSLADKRELEKVEEETAKEDK